MGDEREMYEAFRLCTNERELTHVRDCYLADSKYPRSEALRLYRAFMITLRDRLASRTSTSLVESGGFKSPLPQPKLSLTKTEKLLWTAILFLTLLSLGAQLDRATTRQNRVSPAVLVEGLR